MKMSHFRSENRTRAILYVCVLKID